MFPSPWTSPPLCGFKLFINGRAAHDNAVKTEIIECSDLEYRARFVARPSGGEYNTREIA